ncbi:hypothetical protein C8Q79DRAFT_161193 [Trametes meyenii]|nr:hypothetical protein C8Q79DRAFT_161193 [Trametes meyenii]
MLLDSSHYMRRNPSPWDGKVIPGLSTLNEDVLNHLFDELQARKLLAPFSHTCREIRERCMPILFRSCTVRECLPFDEFPLPRSLWRYIKHLELVDGCYEYPLIVRAWRSGRMSHVPFPGDALTCHVYEGPALEDALHNMPGLRAVTLASSINTSHGFSLAGLRAILSVPQLEVLSVRGPALVPELLTGDVVCLDTIPALTSLQYCFAKRRPRSDAVYPSERQTIELILRQLHDTLQTLFLPVELMPFFELSTFHWPALRELRLRGEYDCLKAGCSPIISFLGNMPQLRILALELALPTDQGPTPIWPEDLLVDLPWPLLEELTVSFPVTDDAIYSNLPPTLRRLSLVCYPHYMRNLPMYTASGRWHSPLISASDVLSILRKCHLPLLTKLKLEYQEDWAEEQLLRHVGVAFPELVCLKIFRNRVWERGELPLDMIIESLSPLSRLRTFGFHPDLVDAPGSQSPSGKTLPTDDCAVHNFQETRLRPIANRIVDNWPSVEVLRFLSPKLPYHSWASYCVVRCRDRSPHVKPIPGAEEYIDLGPLFLKQAKRTGRPLDFDTNV